MSLTFSHKPNYFFFAQTLINFLTEQLRTQPAESKTFALADIYQLFKQDFAATTANLEGILNIADNYFVGSDSARCLIQNYHINADANVLNLNLNPSALQALAQGEPVNAPDAADYS